MIFSPEEKYRGHLPASLQLPADIAKMISRNYADIASPEAIRGYFETMYRVSGEMLDKKDIVEKLEHGAADNFSFPFAEVAEKFRLIENDTVAVLIPKEPEAQTLLQRLRAGEASRAIFREIGPYCVNLYRPDFGRLYDCGKIELLQNGVAVLADPDAYSDETGLACTVDSGSAWFV